MNKLALKVMISKLKRLEGVDITALAWNTNEGYDSQLMPGAILLEIESQSLSVAVSKADIAKMVKGGYLNENQDSIFITDKSLKWYDGLADEVAIINQD